MIRRLMAMCLLAFPIATQGCSPQVIASNERGGIISHVTGLTQADAFKLANDHCHKFGRVAQVTNTDVIYNRMTFACVEP